MMDLFGKDSLLVLVVNLLSTSPKNGQTQSNNLSATANEMSKGIWPFCRVGA